MARLSLADEIAAVCSICRQLGLGEVSPTLLKAAHHTTLLISPLTFVARVQSAGALDFARQRATRELALARHLAGHGAPVLAPLGEALAGPHIAASCVVTFWPYVEHERTARDADAALAAATLAAVHRGLCDYAGDLPPYTRTLDRCWLVLADAGASAAFSGGDQELLKMHYRRLRRDVEAAASDWVPLHGDAHPGNLLLGRRHGPLWTDFEDGCLGPREHDIACLPPAAWPLFLNADQMLIGRFAALKSVCVAVWCGNDALRSMEVREAAEYHLERIRGLAC